jgi:hypothetical protein
MPSFQQMFEKTKGKPIVYKGETLVMVDFFLIEDARKFALVFERCNSKWRQGVALNCDGSFNINGERLSGKRGVVFWQDTAPQTVTFEIAGKVSEIQVKNVWDVGDGVTHSWHNGAAMIIELLPNGRRYRCNDGFADDYFDDIIFRLERMSK